MTCVDYRKRKKIRAEKVSRNFGRKRESYSPRTAFDEVPKMAGNWRSTLGREYRVVLPPVYNVYRYIRIGIPQYLTLITASPATFFTAGGNQKNSMKKWTLALALNANFIPRVCPFFGHKREYFSRVFFSVYGKLCLSQHSRKRLKV